MEELIAKSISLKMVKHYVEAEAIATSGSSRPQALWEDRRQCGSNPEPPTIRLTVQKRSSGRSVVMSAMPTSGQRR
jgi:hypothetical protein